MKTANYLNFAGDCEAAFTRYAEVLGGQIAMMMRFADVPPGVMEGPSGCDRNGIMHAALTLPGGDMLMASDVPPAMYEKPQGFSVSLSLDSVDEVNRIFAALSEGGAVTMPVGETFWSHAFTMFTDKWGTPWMLNGPDKAFG